MPPDVSDRRAAVASFAFEIVRARAGDGVSIVSLDDDVDLASVDFLVPPSNDGDLLAELPSLTNVSVIQVLSAGTDWIEAHLPPQATLCNARGARDGPVAEWILGALLGTSSGVLDFARATRWERRRIVEDLGAWTIVVVGMGSIGRRLAAYLEPIGAQVVGVGSRAHDGLYGPDELPELVSRADAVVVLAPLTPATEGLVDAHVLGRMRDGSLLVNAGRGAVVDTDALVDELSTGRLRAVLDVVDPEPLPEDHPLWRAPGLLSMTPHIAGDSPAGHRRAAELAGDQLGRWSRGEPLINVVREGR